MLLCYRSGRLKRDLPVDNLGILHSILSENMEHLTTCSSCQEVLTAHLKSHEKELGLGPPLSVQERGMLGNWLKGRPPIEALHSPAIPMRARYKAIIFPPQKWKSVHEIIEQALGQEEEEADYSSAEMAKTMHAAAETCDRMRGKLHPCYNCGDEMYALWNTNGQFFLVHPGMKGPWHVTRTGGLVTTFCEDCTDPDTIIALNLPGSIESAVLSLLNDEDDDDA